MSRRAIVGLACAALMLALGACGKSKEDKAMDSVCSARADIAKQVDHLKGVTPSTATIGDVQQSLKAISSDLSKIKDAQGDLKGDRRAQVQKANDAFTSQLKDTVSNVGKSLSPSGAKTQLTSAVQQLAGAYKTALQPIDCGS
ncbi:MAG TPA: hypothetical protein VN751_12185 [Solirubrobacteraceae bacterium]|nr:hypothetical protein [Solirubrobacteraceae bacterium]